MSSASNSQYSKNSFLVFVTEYIYSSSVVGSLGILSNFSTLVNVVCQNVHCVQASVLLYVIETDSVGSGYFHQSILNSSRLVLILLMSETLALSLALFEYHCKLINAIVHNMANIVITTISSTNVNPCFFIFFIVINK